MCVVVPYIFETGNSGTTSAGRFVVPLSASRPHSVVAGAAYFNLTSRCDRVIAAGISFYEDPYAILTSTASLQMQGSKASVSYLFPAPGTSVSGPQWRQWQLEAIQRWLMKSKNQEIRV
jgi:hypothetical protein